MGWKCAPQVKGLVRGEPKPNAKHRANGGKILAEMGNERFSRSDTLDRTRSHLNKYDDGFSAGLDCWAAMQAEADNYKIKGKTKDGKEFEKRLRADAVIGWSVIINPPADMTVGWTRERYAAFYRDSREVLAEIMPELFRAENVRMSATHRDEGELGPDGKYSEHQHYAGVSRDADGRYCGNLVDAKLMVIINQEYPRMMRGRNWDLDDLDVTDFERMGKNEDGTYRDPEYRASRLGRKKGGKDVNKYIADKARDAERAYMDAIEQVKQAKQLHMEMEIRSRAVIEQELQVADRERQVADREREVSKQAHDAAISLKRSQDALERVGGLDNIKRREAAVKRQEEALRGREEQLNEKAEKLDARERRLAQEQRYLSEARRPKAPNGQKHYYHDFE